MGSITSFSSVLLFLTDIINGDESPGRRGEPDRRVADIQQNF